MFRSTRVIVATAAVLCATAAAPALARVPDDERPRPARVTHRCHHSETTDAATGRPGSRVTTYGARCVEA